MSIEVFVASDFRHMSSIAAGIVKKAIAATLPAKREFVLGLATGRSPSGMYKLLAKAANEGEFDSGRIRSFNLDEYVGLPGGNVQQRVMHPESYCYFMIQEFFSLLTRKFIETNVPSGALIDPARLAKELKSHPKDWKESGHDAGRSIAIKPKTASRYLAWVKEAVLDDYAKSIKRSGGIDLQVIGVGGRGHVAFHESGIPFEGSRVMLVKLDRNTIRNAVADGHFRTEKDSPRYAVSMGAELVYSAKTVVLLANGERKAGPVAESLLNEVTPDVPISYGQRFSKRGGRLVYVLDRVAARDLLSNRDLLKKKGISVVEP